MKKILLAIMFGLLLFTGCSNWNVNQDDNNNNRTIFQDDNGNQVNVTDSGNITVYGWENPIGEYVITENDTRFLFSKEQCDVIIDTNVSLGLVCIK